MVEVAAKAHYDHLFQRVKKKKLWEEQDEKVKEGIRQEVITILTAIMPWFGKRI